MSKLNHQQLHAWYEKFKKAVYEGANIDMDRIEDIGEDALKCKKLVLPSNGSLLSQLTFNF